MSSTMQTRWIKSVRVLPLLLLVALGCKKEGEGAGTVQMPAAAVNVAAAEARDVPRYVLGIGSTAATESVTIQPQVTGRVTQIHFTDGAMIKKGDLLFTIDARPFQAVLDQATATLAQKEATEGFPRSLPNTLKLGSPTRARTWNLLINSQSLYH